jgi:hypothetical protein
MKTRWIVFDMGKPWHQCLSAAIPFLADARTDSALLIAPQHYRGPHDGERDVILGPHVAPELAEVFRAFGDRIDLYQTENVLDPASPWAAPIARLRLECPNRWLNYSAANAAMYGDTVHPLQKLHHLPARDDRTPRPIDVLFVGSLNYRRAAVLNKLLDAGLKVYGPPGPVFGADLARLEAKAKVLLNVHYYTPGVFEAFRVVPAAHRGTPVISEKSERNEGAEWAPCYPYADLVEATIAAVKGQSRG